MSAGVFALELGCCWTLPCCHQCCHSKRWHSTPCPAELFPFTSRPMFFCG